MLKSNIFDTVDYIKYSLNITLWRRKWQPTPVFLPGKFHGQRSLVVYSPWGRKESDTTEQLHIHYVLLPPQVVLVVENLPANAEGIRLMASITVLGRSPGRVHDNPLQYSCLENPMDRGTLWVAVHKVTLCVITVLYIACTYLRNTFLAY